MAFPFANSSAQPFGVSRSSQAHCGPLGNRIQTVSERGWFGHRLISVELHVPNA